jgi:hypothetical protein
LRRDTKRKIKDNSRRKKRKFTKSYRGGIKRENS